LKRLYVPAGIALALGASCVLPAYSVGGSTSSSAAGGSTSSVATTGGAGGAAQSSSTGISVGPGGAGLGGSGIGGDLNSCTSTTTGIETVWLGDTPHGVTLSTNYVYWITDSSVYATTRMAPHLPKPFALANVCSISGSTYQAEDKVVIRTNDGTIFVLKPPNGPLSTIFPGSGRTLNGGACAISLAGNGDDLYGFDVDTMGVYSVVKYTLSSHAQTTFASAMGTPVAIDATDADNVAWVEGMNGNGVVYIYSKAMGTMTFSQGGGWTDVCAYGKPGTFAFTDPSTNIIDSWSVADGPGSFAFNVHPNWIACDASFRAWIDYGDGCANLFHQQKQFAAPASIAMNQPRACSIAIAGATAFWTNCEPSGGVYKARMQ
jgi:hypothetical protein